MWALPRRMERDERPVVHPALLQPEDSMLDFRSRYTGSKAGPAMELFTDDALEEGELHEELHEELLAHEGAHDDDERARTQPRRLSSPHPPLPAVLTLCLRRE